MAMDGKWNVLWYTCTQFPGMVCRESANFLFDQRTGCKKCLGSRYWIEHYSLFYCSFLDLWTYTSRHHRDFTVRSSYPGGRKKAHRKDIFQGFPAKFFLDSVKFITEPPLKCAYLLWLSPNLRPATFYCSHQSSQSPGGKDLPVYRK